MSRKSSRKAARQLMQHPYRIAASYASDAAAYLNRAADNRDNAWLHFECLGYAKAMRLAASKQGVRLP